MENIRKPYKDPTEDNAMKNIEKRERLKMKHAFQDITLYLSSEYNVTLLSIECRFDATGNEYTVKKR